MVFELYSPPLEPIVVSFTWKLFYGLASVKFGKLIGYAPRIMGLCQCWCIWPSKYWKYWRYYGNGHFMLLTNVLLDYAKLNEFSHLVIGLIKGYCCTKAFTRHGKKWIMDLGTRSIYHDEGRKRAAALSITLCSVNSVRCRPLKR